MANIGLYIASQTYNMTQGKFLFLAWLLTEAGHEVTALTINPDAIKACQEKGVAVLIPRLESEPVAVIEEAKKLHQLLTNHITHSPNAPTWGDLLAFDDFIGGAQGFDIQGVGSWQPDILIQSNHGAESSTPEDEALELVVWRWAAQNKIPTIALEVQHMGGPLSITDYPHTKTIQQHQMPPAHRHYCRTGQDPQLERFLAEESHLRDKLELPIGMQAIVMPFHLYYLQECMEALKELGQWAQVMDWKGKVLVPCGGAVRRMYKEKDIVEEGCKRWWKELGQIEIVEGLEILTLALVSEGMFVPYNMTQVRDIHQRYDIPVWKNQGLIAVGKSQRLETVIKEVLSANK